MSVDINTLTENVLGFYLSWNIVAALAGSIPGALAEKKNCASLERFHFLLFFFGGAAVLLFLYNEIARSLLEENVWKAQLAMSLVAGFYLGNVASRRLRNAGKQKILAVLIWVPMVNIALLIALAAMPTAMTKKAKAVAAAQNSEMPPV